MGSKQPIRIVVDTNIWISLLIGRSLENLLTILDGPNFELIGTDLLFQEVAEVTQRGKFAKHFSPKDAQQLLKWMKSAMTNIKLNADIPRRCRDIEDDYLLELAIQSHAIYLVSGDNDLLSIGEIEGCKIMTVSQFINDVKNSQ